MSRNIVTRFDDIIGRLKQARTYGKNLPDDFFTNPKYSSMWVPINEISDLQAYLKMTVTRTFGAGSPEEETINRAMDTTNARFYDTDTDFDYQLRWLERVRSAADTVLPREVKVEGGYTANITFQGPVIGSTVGGRDATSTFTDGAAAVSINPQAVKDTIEIMKDLFGGKQLSGEQTIELQAITQDLKTLEGEEKAHPSRLQKLIGKVTDFGGKVLTGAASKMLSDQVMGIIHSPPF